MIRLTHRLLQRIRLGSPAPKYRNLDRKVFTVRNLDCLLDFFGWDRQPQLDPADYRASSPDLIHLNQRRLRDAEVLATVCANTMPATVLEIGTSHGRSTVLIAENVPAETAIHTVNLPPEEADTAGKNITHVLSREDIGREYRQRNYTNIHQIYVNTWGWSPQIGPIDVVFVDGCHDAKFVVNDTRAILPHMQPGGWIIWHDFCPPLAPKHTWIAEVCRGIDQLIGSRNLTAPIFHLEDSWMGVYRLPGGEKGVR